MNIYEINRSGLKFIILAVCVIKTLCMLIYKCNILEALHGVQRDLTTYIFIDI